MVHLNELHERYAEKGLTVLGVSQQDRSAIEDFVEELEAKYPIVAEKSDSMRAYGRTSFPSAFLIDTGGRVLWVGHPGNVTDAQIEEALSKATILPAWPGELKDAQKSFGKDRYAEALARIEKHLASDTIEDESRATAEAIRDWLLWFGSSNLEGARQDVEAGRFYEASCAYELVADLYKKHELAAQAERALEDLLDDDDHKLEIKAGEKLARILEEIEGESAKKALKKLQPLLSRKYAETAAGKKAAALAEALEKEAS